MEQRRFGRLGQPQRLLGQAKLDLRVGVARPSRGLSLEQREVSAQPIGALGLRRKVAVMPDPQCAWRDQAAGALNTRQDLCVQVELEAMRRTIAEDAYFFALEVIGQGIGRREVMQRDKQSLGVAARDARAELGRAVGGQRLVGIQMQDPRALTGFETDVARDAEVVCPDVMDHACAKRRGDGDRVIGRPRIDDDDLIDDARYALEAAPQIGRFVLDDQGRAEQHVASLTRAPGGTRGPWTCRTAASSRGPRSGPTCDCSTTSRRGRRVCPRPAGLRVRRRRHTGRA